MSKTTKTCGCCETSKNLTQFYKSPIDSSCFLPICKNCCKRKYKAYSEILKKDSAALWLVLSELGVPFFMDIWNTVELGIVGAGPSTDVVMFYLRTLSESGRIVHGFWESDTMLDMLIDTSVDREAELEEIDYAEQQRIWGRFLIDDKLDTEAYEFLNKTYEDYTEDRLDMDANVEKRFRDLAKCELRLRRANEAGDGGEISKAQESLNKQLSLLKMNDFQNNKQSDIDKHISRMAWTIENTKPAECEDLNKYKDFSGIGIKWEELLRPMRNLICGTREYPDIPKGEQ